jgi:DNA-binding transcriptional regulator LsrR (DeoR family)
VKARNDRKIPRHYADLLADVAEMYYLEGKIQSEIAETVGVTRSMISRMLTDAREAGIVEIRIHRSEHSEPELAFALRERFGLADALVINAGRRRGEGLTRALGEVAARVLQRHLAPGKVLALAWGTSISATVDEFETSEPIRVSVVQLVGAMGARITQYDGHDLVARMAQKIGGDAYYLHAPYICETAEVAESLLQTGSIRETIEIGKRSDIALLGIGTTAPDFSSFYLAGYITSEQLDDMRQAGAVGDVCGAQFDINGQPACPDFCNRLVSIRRPDLMAVPVRLGVAGGEGKATAILGALRGRYVNVLVTDSHAARKVLELADSH